MAARRYSSKPVVITPSKPSMAMKMDPVKELTNPTAPDWSDRPYVGYQSIETLKLDPKLTSHLKKAGIVSLVDLADYQNEVPQLVAAIVDGDPTHEITQIRRKFFFTTGVVLPALQ